MRHAKRAGGLDTLAADGHKQAEGLPEALRTKLAKLGKQQAPGDLTSSATPRWRIFASPKTRTQQTLRFLSEAVGTSSEIFEALDERTSQETQTQFENRVRHVLDSWHDEINAVAPNPLIHEVRIACSHLDWLEAAALFLSSDESDLERSAPWVPLETRIYFLRNGIWNRFRR